MLLPPRPDRPHSGAADQDGVHDLVGSNSHLDQICQLSCSISRAGAAAASASWNVTPITLTNPFPLSYIHGFLLISLDAVWPARSSVPVSIRPHCREGPVKLRPISSRIYSRGVPLSFSIATRRKVRRKFPRFHLTASPTFEPPCSKQEKSAENER